jgi:hypothetical protein
VRAFLDAGLRDELTVTVVPIVLGSGIPLGAGTVRRHALAGGMVQLTYTRA